MYKLKEFIVLSVISTENSKKLNYHTFSMSFSSFFYLLQMG